MDKYDYSYYNYQYHNDEHHEHGKPVPPDEYLVYNDTDVDQHYIVNNVFTVVFVVGFLSACSVYVTNYYYLKCIKYLETKRNYNINVNNLTTIIVDKVDDNCSICLEYYKSNDIISKIKCGHMFHKECLKPWIDSENYNCPLCRRNII